MKIKKFNILFLTILIVVESQYEIPSYYGFWSKRFYQPTFILNGEFSIFEMHLAIDLSYDSQTVYFADESQHCIFSYNLAMKKYTLLAGKYSIPGDKVGNSESAYFNSPSSIVYYRPDPLRSTNATRSKVYLTMNETCSLEDPDCILDDVKLQTLEISLTLKNIRISPSTNLFSINQQITDEYLFITDKMNHCIKKITLKTKYIEVVAGFCGQAGFLDGPMGFNRLNQPSNIGIDPQGVIYFFDEGNEYMRKINLDNSVETLLNGACTEYVRSIEPNRKVNQFELKKLICYSNWIEKKTGSTVQHYFSEELLNICTLHSSKCS